MGHADARTQDYMEYVLSQGVVNAYINGFGQLKYVLRDGSEIDAELIVNKTTIEARVVALEPKAGENVWYYIGAAGQPPFGSGVSNFAGSYQTVRYRKDKGVVRLDGLAKITTGASGMTLFTLPPNYAPTRGTLLFNTNVNARSSVEAAGTSHYHDLFGIGGRIDIQTTGAVNFAAPSGYVAPNTHLTLTGITFSID